MTWDPKKSALCCFITELRDVHKFGLHPLWDPCTRIYDNPAPEMLEHLAARNQIHMFRLSQEAVQWSRRIFEREGGRPVKWPVKVDSRGDALHVGEHLRRNFGQSLSPGLASTVEALRIAGRPTSDEAPGECAVQVANTLRALVSGAPEEERSQCLRSAGELVSELSGETVGSGAS
jgi:hypothetical protein